MLYLGNFRFFVKYWVNLNLVAKLQNETFFGSFSNTVLGPPTADSRLPFDPHLFLIRVEIEIGVTNSVWLQ